MSDRETIRTIVRTLYDFQDLRIRLAGRLRKKADGSDMKMREGVDEIDLDESALPVMKSAWIVAEEKEAELKHVLDLELKGIPIYEQFLKGAKGVGPQMAGVIISEFDIHKATTVSKLWMFAGLATGTVKGYKWDKKKKAWYRTDVDIPADRLTADFRSPFNRWLRTKLCGALASSFLKCDSPYREFYDNMKGRLEQKDGWKEAKKPGHRHRGAIRYMIKMFLKDLYVAWRTIEGLPVRPPYQEEYLGHKHAASE